MHELGCHMQGIKRVSTGKGQTLGEGLLSATRAAACTFRSGLPEVGKGCCGMASVFLLKFRPVTLEQLVLLRQRGVPRKCQIDSFLGILHCYSVGLPLSVIVASPIA